MASGNDAVRAETRRVAWRNAPNKLANPSRGTLPASRLFNRYSNTLDPTLQRPPSTSGKLAPPTNTSAMVIGGRLQSLGTPRKNVSTMEKTPKTRENADRPPTQPPQKNDTSQEKPASFTLA